MKRKTSKKSKVTKKVTSKVTSIKAGKVNKTRVKVKKTTRKVTSKVTSKVTKKTTKKKDGKGLLKDILKRGARKPKQTRKKGKKVEEPEVVYVAPKSYKIVGYCPKCDMFISTKDFESKMIFSCVRCGIRKHKKYLLNDQQRLAKAEKISKKQYLSDAEADNKHIEKSNLNNVANLPNISVMGGVQEQ